MGERHLVSSPTDRSRGDVDVTRWLKRGGPNTSTYRMMGDHGRAHVRGKQWPYDSGLKIPLIIYFPRGVEKPRGFGMVLE